MARPAGGHVARAISAATFARPAGAAALASAVTATSTAVIETPNPIPTSSSNQPMGFAGRRTTRSAPIEANDS